MLLKIRCLFLAFCFIGSAAAHPLSSFVQKLFRPKLGAKICEEGLKNAALESLLAEAPQVTVLHDKNFSFQPASPHSERGFYNNGTFTIEFADTEYFVKKIKPDFTDPTRGLKEILMYKKLSDLGVVPTFRGVFVFDDGQYGLVSDFARDTLFLRFVRPGQFNKYLKKFKNSSQSFDLWVESLRDILAKLNEAQISINDLQILLYQSGEAKLIDVAWFRHYPAKFEDFAIGNTRVFKMFIESLRSFQEKLH